jgi:signal transduction histidine kinase
VRISLKAKQIAGVTLIVGLATSGLSAFYLASVAKVSLDESRARANMLVSAIFQRARTVVEAPGDRYEALRDDGGLRAILESSAYDKNMTYAAIANVNGEAIAHSDAAKEGLPIPAAGDLEAVLDAGAFARLRLIYEGQGRMLERREPLLLDNAGQMEQFGSIRVGVSTLLIRGQITQALKPAFYTTMAALVAAVFVSILLAQVLLRPINLIRSGLTRLGKGEVGVTIDLARDDEFGDLGASFNAVSARLAVDPSHADGATLEEVLRYSRKLAALGRLSAGVAHEVKNPLNATMIHLELLKMQLAGESDAIDRVAAMEHVQVISAEMRRLDEVVQGFLKFTRPEELELRPVAIADVIAAMTTIVATEAQAHRVDLVVDCPSHLPLVRADAALLQQAFLNLALNAIQAMPDGGRLRIAAAVTRRGQVGITFEDTGVGIDADKIDRIFDLYFTTKARGSGIGLSMVFRTVQLHDGEIEVESSPGQGTTFRVTLPAVSPKPEGEGGR